jgi:hypothetical protein
VGKEVRTPNLKGTEETLVLFKKPEVQYITLHQLKKGSKKFWISDVNRKAWVKAHKGAEILDEEVITKTWEDRMAGSFGSTGAPDRRVSTFMTDDEAVERLIVLMMGGNGYARHLFGILQNHGHLTRTEWFKVHEMAMWSETNYLLYGHY